jgi:hypothetical protein
MADYTFQASRVSELSYGGDLVPLTLSTVKPAGPHPYRGDCPEHGIHTHQELERPFVIEKEGDEWRLPEDYAVSYCEECVAEHRTEVRLLEAETLDDALERENVDLREVVRSMVKINWRHLRDAFKPSDPSNLETIPVGEGA